MMMKVDVLGVRAKHHLSALVHALTQDSERKADTIILVYRLISVVKQKAYLRLARVLLWFQQAQVHTAKQLGLLVMCTYC